MAKDDGKSVATDDDGPPDDDNALDVLQASAARRLRVIRTDVHDLPPGSVRTDWAGHCGYVANREGFEDEIRANWGGGRYDLEGRGSDRKPLVVRGVLIPGPSRPLYDDEDEEGPVVMGPPQRGYPPHGQSPYPAPLAGYPPGYTGPPPGPHGYPPAPPWYGGYSHTTPAEVQALREKVAAAERERDDLRKDVVRLERESEQAKSAAREEKLRADFRKELADLRGTHGPDPSSELVKALITAQAAKAGKDEQAAAAQAAQFMQMFQTMNAQAQQFMTTLITSKGSQSDLLANIAALQKIQGNPIEQFQAMVGSMKQLGLMKDPEDDDEDDDDEEKASPIEEVGKAIVAGAVKMLTKVDATQVQQQPAPQPPPVQPPQIPGNGNGHGKQESPTAMSSAQWLKVMQIILQVSTLPAEQAAEHFRAAAGKAGLGQSVALLGSETPASVLAKVEPAAAQLAAVPGAGAHAEVLQKVVALLKSQQGVAWATTLIERLKAVGS